ncbi:MAG: MBOAT family O-acyltransferase [Leadbetterella sp.]
MLFNSVQFLLFYIVITLAYFSLRHRGRIWLLLLASTYFYMVFKPIYVFILLITIGVDYFAGILIDRSEGKKRKMWLILSLVMNIGFLAFFKYFNFFNENLDKVLELIGGNTPFDMYSYALPIGLSFHTFQAMSYTIEVYRKNQKPERDFIVYSLYVMFYPQLVAGPIERPQNLLPQFHTFKKYDFSNLKAGLLQMAWGLFKKVVIADRLTLYVDYCFDNPEQHTPLTLLVGVIFFSIQIYCDFSGYSDIAIGAARTMGFDLMMNFNAPYLAKNIGDFWRRWHISLSTWFKDYLYIPLGGNRVSEIRLYLNYFFVFLVSGLWHGSKWTFIVWGAIHGAYQVGYMIRKKYASKLFPEIPIVSQLTTFILVMIAWVFFRATGIHNSLVILTKITSLNYSDGIELFFSQNEFIFCWLLIVFLYIRDIIMKGFDLKKSSAFYTQMFLLAISIYFLGVFDANQFIYFQF